MIITRDEQLRDYISEALFNEYVVFEGDEDRYCMSDFGDYIGFQDEFYGENVEVFEYGERCNEKFIEWFRGYNPASKFEDGKFISIS